MTVKTYSPVFELFTSYPEVIKLVVHKLNNLQTEKWIKKFQTPDCQTVTVFVNTEVPEMVQLYSDWKRRFRATPDVWCPRSSLQEIQCSAGPFPIPVVKHFRQQH